MRGQVEERHTRRWLFLLFLFLVLLILPVSVNAQDAAKFFEENCALCHTIGSGPLIGPDLKGVTQRRTRDQLIRFLRNPEAFTKSSDPYAKQLLQASGGVVMPSFPQMTPELASTLLDFIEAKSNPSVQQPSPAPETHPAQESTQAPSPVATPAEGVEISDRPFTPGDVEQGGRIFAGRIIIIQIYLILMYILL